MFTVDPGLFPMVLSCSFSALANAFGSRVVDAAWLQLLQLQVAKNSGEAKGVGDMS